MLSIQNSNDFFSQIVNGNVNGYSALRVYGINPDAAAGTEDMNSACGVSAGDGAITTITRPSAAVAMYISSSAAGDTTQYATITGLDANYDVVTATIKLAGRTKTAVGASFLRINSVTLTATAAGNVFVYQDDTVTTGIPDHKVKVMAVVPIGALVANQGFYTVPNGYNAYVYMGSFNSYNATTAFGTIVILDVTYSGTTVSRVLGRYADPGSGQYQFTAQPIECLAGTDIKLKSTLAATGTAQIIEGSLDIVLEEATATVAYTTAYTLGAYQAHLTSATHTHSTNNLYLIGLDEVPTSIPTQFILADLLTPAITGSNAIPLRISTAYSPLEIAFDPAYFSTGRLIVTDKKAILCVWKCTDSNGDIYYVVSPSTPVIKLDPKVKKITFQA
jgi:hypothetical protein